uniref:Uncharacterized protein n=4 Tax=Clytia hemisphaerica TaxID=252671 RepID=A0A7M5X9F2_9CNID
MNNIRELVIKTEQNLDIKKSSTGKQKRDYSDTVKKLAHEMKNQNPFVNDETYKSYESFEYFDDTLLTKQDTTKLLEWTKEKSREFKKRLEIQNKKNTDIHFDIEK